MIFWPVYKLPEQRYGPHIISNIRNPMKFLYKIFGFFLFAEVSHLGYFLQNTKILYFFGKQSKIFSSVLYAKETYSENYHTRTTPV